MGECMALCWQFLLHYLDMVAQLVANGDGFVSYGLVDVEVELLFGEEFLVLVMVLELSVVKSLD